MMHEGKRKTLNTIVCPRSLGALVTNCNPRKSRRPPPGYIFMFRLYPLVQCLPLPPPLHFVYILSRNQKLPIAIQCGSSWPYPRNNRTASANSIPTIKLVAFDGNVLGPPKRRNTHVQRVLVPIHWNLLSARHRHVIGEIKRRRCRGSADAVSRVCFTSLKPVGECGMEVFGRAVKKSIRMGGPWTLYDAVYSNPVP